MSADPVAYDVLPPATGSNLVRLEIGAVASSSGPDLPAAIQYFHPGTPDGWLSFYRGPEFQPVGAVQVPVLREALRADTMQPWLPGLVQALLVDAHMTINATYRAGVKVRTRHRYVNADIEGQRCQVERRFDTVERIVPGSGGLHHPYRAIAGVRWLTACYVDVDGYGARVPTDGPGTVANILRAYRGATIPVPSFIFASGRGAWGFWQIVDERNPAEGEQVLHGVRHRANTPCRASRYAVALHRRINEALAARLAPYGADCSAVDAARCCRVPGSRNSDADDAIVEILPVMLNGAMRVYTLTELEQLLQLPRVERGRPPADIGRGRLNDAQHAQRLRAMHARHRRVYDAIQMFADLRDGLPDGTRHNALFYLALSGYLAGVERGDVQSTVWRLARTCQSDGHGKRVDEADVRAILKSAATKAKHPTIPASYAAVANRLQMTDREQKQVQLVPRTPQVLRNTAARDRAILGWLDDHGRQHDDAPPTRDMAAVLRGLGFSCSHNAVAEAYRRLGVRSRRPVPVRTDTEAEKAVSLFKAGMVTRVPYSGEGYKDEEEHGR